MGLSIVITQVAMRRSRLLTLLLNCLSLVMLLTANPALAQHVAPLSHDSAHTVGHDGHDRTASGEVWEGSEKGIAYSERNHHIAGFMVLLMGLAELCNVLRLQSLRWARLLLPSALIFAGFFILVWSDHEAWPIGSLSFGETFLGEDHEILQHKTYGILAFLVGSVELFRRLGRIGHKAWASPLPLMAIVGGLMLFGHSHGFHPSAPKIAMHHAIMGTMAVTAGSSKLVSAWVAPNEGSSSTGSWEWLWVSLILLIGAQLLLYSE
jgi:putative copper resistance protein D